MHNKDAEELAEWKRLRQRTANYGITPRDYDKLFVAQQGRCAICRKEPPAQAKLCIDHDHATGAVRGLLCTFCNYALGYFKDDPERIISSLSYLNKPPARDALVPDPEPESSFVPKSQRGEHLADWRDECRGIASLPGS